MSTDLLERRLSEAEVIVSRARAVQLEVLEELDRRQVATADGSRSLSEWLAARIDVSPTTAKGLVRTMRRTADQPGSTPTVGFGVCRFDRVEALSRLCDREPDDLLLWTDVAGVHREAAKRVRVTAETETRSHQDRFLVMQPSLDESWWKGWFGLDGYTGALFDKFVSAAADALPDDVEGGCRMAAGNWSDRSVAFRHSPRRAGDGHRRHRPSRNHEW